MNYFVPPQGIPGLVPMQQVMQMSPQMVGHPSLQQMMHGQMQPQLQHMAGMHRLLPVAQAQYAPPGYTTVPQYQQAQIAAARQQSLQRAVNTISTSRVVVTPKTPPHHVHSKPICVDAEVQTHECDPNPEADSSTKARIVKSILACCSTIVSTEYRHLQSRILSWGEQIERQALEVTRVQADVGPDDSCPMPVTLSSVMILDDGKLQFIVNGKVIKSSIVAEREDNQLEDENLREYLDMLGDTYSFCCGLSDKEIHSVDPFALMRCNNLVSGNGAFHRAFSLCCSKWCKIPDGSARDEVRCVECILAYEKLQSESKIGTECGTKRPVAIGLDDLPTEPQAKRPRLLEVTTAHTQLEQMCSQIQDFRDFDNNKTQESISNFLESLSQDMEHICSLYKGVQGYVQEVEEEEEEKEEEEKEEEGKQACDQTDDNMEVNDKADEEDVEEAQVTETCRAEVETEMESTEVETETDNTESKLIDSASPVGDSEEIDEEALLNGVESNPEQNHVAEKCEESTEQENMCALTKCSKEQDNNEAGESSQE